MIVECRNVSKSFGSRLAVADLDLEVPPGVCFGLLGPNGAGKTTTLRMIYGATQASRGELRVFGLDVARETREVRTRLGVTLQENALIEVLSPVRNLQVFGRYHRLSGKQSEKRIDELLDFLDLRSHANVPVRELSGGFQRRLAIALSLMNRPELLVLDEPTTGLDPAVRISLWDRVRALRDDGTTVLLTTHYMEEAERLCDELAILAQGRVVAQGAPKQLVRDVLAPEALELELKPAEQAELLRDLHGLHQLRTERRLVLYSDDAAALLQTLRQRGGSRSSEQRPLSVRPTNLEDVFLALTGASLEGGA